MTIPANKPIIDGTPCFDNSYVRLPNRFFARQSPQAVANPGLIRVNKPLAALLGFDAHWLASEEGVRMMAGNAVPDGANPIATVYAGHQFGSWNPQLGDGRAILLGEVIASDGKRYDIQLKGSGRTAYSRGGDGRSPLGPVLREYLISEAMARLGVPTTRSLGAVTTGETVYREQTLPGAVLTRVAQSHIRIGTVQFFASRRDAEGLRALVDHVIQRHYPHAIEADNPVRALLDGVVKRQASLVARWQLLGFIHGVMNTDNMLLSGETIDYGPCAFMDTFDPATVYSSIDQGGRYAYQNQPGIAHWNISCLAQALLPLLDEDADEALAQGQAAIDAFPELFQQAYRQGLGRKLGLTESTPADDELFSQLLALMKDTQSDFTLTFRRLADLAGTAPSGPVEDGAPSGQNSEHQTGGHNTQQGPSLGPPVSGLYEFPGSFTPWLDKWRQRLAQDQRSAAARQADMYVANPVFIPRNHLVQEAISAAEEQQDFRPFNRLTDILAEPFRYDPALERYATPPLPEQVVRQTFCGT